MTHFPPKVVVKISSHISSPLYLFLGCLENLDSVWQRRMQAGCEIILNINIAQCYQGSLFCASCISV